MFSKEMSRYRYYFTQQNLFHYNDHMDLNVDDVNDDHDVFFGGRDDGHEMYHKMGYFGQQHVPFHCHYKSNRFS